MTENHIPLTSSEIASLWTSYLNNTMSHCIMGYFLETVENADIKPIVDYSYQLTKEHTTFLKNTFSKENFAMPVGFTDSDVNFKAPPLYSDEFILEYINQMAKVGTFVYGGFLAMSTRKDLREHFSACLAGTINLYNLGTDVSLEKGLYTRPPTIPVPCQADYIDNKSYLSGLNPFSEKRPLNAIEISHLFLNIETNLLGSLLCTSFAQTAKDEHVRKFMVRGKDISKKHIKVFGETLLKSEIEPPMASSSTCLTASTIAPFSDKLMMFHIDFLSAGGMGNYSTAGAASQRTDVILNYQRLAIEIGNFAKDGADIMIKNNWMEQPPCAPDRDKLINQPK
ncbi:uncharacterized protein DUF3231 [Scopulibacillus darangshiensis]|uniref:Uncharacterized protein DUF3231 n=1 Tax=Scopulibacillus darangshiensis TaxID=442528 RepID=A0A4R2NWS5_9BACL|nr:DUF3231 family protein [Scopulibacillus darangshiensis]TCP26623.1 uncharacterized protein DUF3231 [Scopulibacillus darangshiensis]